MVYEVSRKVSPPSLHSSKPKMNESVNSTLNNSIIYLGDLSMHTTDKQIEEYFRLAGFMVTSVLKQNHSSYALIQFANESEARELLEKAVIQMDNSPQQFVRVMPYNQPSCFDPNANLIIKNLETYLDESHIILKFKPYGDILSCKLARDPSTGASKCYAFLQFKHKSSALNAIDVLNNTYWEDKYDPDVQYQGFKQAIIQAGFESAQDIDKYLERVASPHTNQGQQLRGKKIYVGIFKTKDEYNKLKTEKEGKPSNLYVKNLGPNIGDRDLFNLFKPFGSIKSAKVRRQRGSVIDTPLGCGFVDFEMPEDAEKARLKLDGYIIRDPVFMQNRTIAVSYADCKSRRMRKKLGLLPGCNDEDSEPASTPPPSVERNDTPAADHLMYDLTFRRQSSDSVNSDSTTCSASSFNFDPEIRSNKKMTFQTNNIAAVTPVTVMEATTPTNAPTNSGLTSAMSNIIQFARQESIKNEYKLFGGTNLNISHLFQF